MNNTRININTLLLALIAFFATWGEGMQMVLLRASVVFPALALLYIIINVNKFMGSFHKGLPIPKEFKFLFLFIFIHTLIFFVFNAQSIGFGSEAGMENDEGFAYGKSSNGTIIFRYFLFLLFSLFVTHAFWNEKDLVIFAFFYVLGFSCTILLGGYHGYSNALIRFSGGLQDPNAMAFDAIISLMFSLFLMNKVKKKALRVIISITIVFEVVAILLSFSRGALMAIAIWVLFYVFQLGFIKNIKRVVLFATIALIVGSVSISYIGIDTEIVKERFSLQEMKESKGSNRGEIWSAYLSNWDRYIVSGTGMTNYSSAIKDNRQGVTEEYETHNMYLLFLVEFGIFGLFLYLLYWRGYLIHYRKTHGADFFLMSMGLLMMVDTFFLNLDKGRTIWIVYAVVNMIWVKNTQLGRRKQYDKVSNLRVNE